MSEVITKLVLKAEANGFQVLRQQMAQTAADVERQSKKIGKAGAEAGSRWSWIKDNQKAQRGPRAPLHFAGANIGGPRFAPPTYTGLGHLSRSEMYRNNMDLPTSFVTPQRSTLGDIDHNFETPGGGGGGRGFWGGMFGRFGGGPRGGGGGGGGGGGYNRFAQGALQQISGLGYIEGGSLGAMGAQAAGGLAARAATGLFNGYQGMVGGGAEGFLSGIQGIPGMGFASSAINAVRMAPGAMQYRSQLAGISPLISGFRGDADSRIAATEGMGGGLGRYAQLMGMDKGTAASILSGAVGQSGGTMASIGRDGGARNILAAEKLGLGGGLAATLLRGNQVGGLSGNLSTLLGGANNAGLQGSEIREYLAKIAGDVANFRQTGIKVDAEGQNKLLQSLTGLGGMGGQRAAAMVGNVQSTMESLGSNGPNNPGQMLLLRAAGYDPNDPDSIVQAQINLQDRSKQNTIFNQAKSQFAKMLPKNASFRQRYAATAGFYKSIGVSASAKEISNIARGVSGPSGVGMGNTDVEGQAMMATREEQQQAMITNQNRATGERNMEFYMSKEQIASDKAASVGAADYVLKKASDTLEATSMVMDKAVDKIYDSMSGLAEAFDSASVRIGNLFGDEKVQQK